MAATQNYSLPLPQLGEPADIRVLDQGTEMIDGIMHGNRTMVAPAWVSTETYNTGNRVVYLGEYYKCKEDGVTGTWDATKWDKTTVGEDIEGLGTGGASALADLDDVAITSPTDGQALLYDDSDDKWKNGTLPDPSVTKTATGNPIEITDAAAAPMVKCVTEIQGSQDLHGYDKPWVGGAGKNKLPMTVDGIKALNTSGTWTGNVYAIANTTFTIETDNGGNVISIVVNGTTDSDFQQLEIPISNSLFGTEIILSKGYNLNDVVVGVTQNGSTKIICLTTEVAGTIPDTGTISCYVRLVANRSANNVKIYPMIRLSTVADSTFEPYSNICPITAYDEGEIEVRGKNIIDISLLALYDVTGTGTTRYGVPVTLKAGKYTLSKGGGTTQLYITNKTNNYSNVQVQNYPYTFTLANDSEIYVRSAVSDLSQWSVTNLQLEKGESATTYEPYTSTTHTTTYPSAIYRGSEDCVNGEVSYDMPVIDLGDLTWALSGNVWYTGVNGLKRPAQTGYKLNAICSSYEIVAQFMAPQATHVCMSGLNWIDGIALWKSGFETAQEVKEAMVGVKLAYLRATPTTSSVTPTNLPIKSLSGYTHIESSTGEMEVEYIRNTYQPIVDLIQSSSHVYSTAEQVVGKWTDGKDVYEKTVVSEVALTSSWQNYVSSSDMDTIISVEARCTRDGEEAQMSFSNSEVASWLNRDGYIKVCTPTNSNDWKILSMTVRYTKTTSNRSLSTPVSLQKAQIEPLEEKGEELPTEEEKTVETPETEEENDER